MTVSMAARWRAMSTGTWAASFRRLFPKHGLQHLDGAAQLPAAQFVPRAHALFLVELDAHVAVPAVGQAFEEKRSLPLAHGGHGVSGRLVDLDHVVAVHPGRTDAVGLGPSGNVLVGLAAAQGRRRAVAIVFAHEQHRQPVQGGEIEGFRAAALFHGAVAKKGHAHPGAVVHFRGQGLAHGMGHAPADNGRGAVDAVARRHGMHGAALAAGATGLAAEAFRGQGQGVVRPWPGNGRGCGGWCRWCPDVRDGRTPRPPRPPVRWTGGPATSCSARGRPRPRHPRRRGCAAWSAAGAAAPARAAGSFSPDGSVVGGVTETGLAVSRCRCTSGTRPRCVRTRGDSRPFRSPSPRATRRWPASSSLRVQVRPSAEVA